MAFLTFYFILVNISEHIEQSRVEMPSLRVTQTYLGQSGELMKQGCLHVSSGAFWKRMYAEGGRTKEL